MTELAALQQQAHANARAKGFHDVADRLKALAESLKESDPELGQLILTSYYSNRLMLIVGELSEAHEEIRSGRAMNEVYHSYKPVPPSLAVEFSNGAEAQAYWETTQTPKPEGVPVELADVAIRLLDLSGEVEVSLEDTVESKMGFNSNRPKMHGGKLF